MENKIQEVTYLHQGQSVKGMREDIIILIDLELLSPYTPVTQVAKVHCKALFSVRHLM